MGDESVLYNMLAFGSEFVLKQIEIFKRSQLSIVNFGSKAKFYMRWKYLIRSENEFTFYSKAHNNM
jgi:hypothetical protein